MHERQSGASKTLPEGHESSRGPVSGEVRVLSKRDVSGGDSGSRLREPAARKAPVGIRSGLFVITLPSTSQRSSELVGANIFSRRHLLLLCTTTVVVVVTVVVTLVVLVVTVVVVSVVVTVVVVAVNVVAVVTVIVVGVVVTVVAAVIVAVAITVVEQKYY
jgi:hypothetical protein